MYLEPRAQSYDLVCDACRRAGAKDHANDEDHDGEADRDEHNERSTSGCEDEVFFLDRITFRYIRSTQFGVIYTMTCEIYNAVQSVAIYANALCSQRTRYCEGASMVTDSALV